MASDYPRICYVPLDERPCNASFPALHLGHAVELVVPPAHLLGAKKTPGDTAALTTWLAEQLPSCDACVASVEQLLYGGLVPSRLHNETLDILNARLSRLRAVFSRNPGVTINLFALIMRTPAYSSSDEEPGYYGRYGEAIYERSVLRDKRNLGYNIDAGRLEQLNSEIPAWVIEDYERRREVNRSVLERVLEMYAEGTVNYLAIPMDDSSRYGYTAADRRHVRGRIVELQLSEQVPVYPGADETGMTLIARAAALTAGRIPSVYPLYRCEQARRHFPKYEGLELESTVDHHIRAAGCMPAESSETCDIVLALHSGPRIDQEAGEQPVGISSDGTSDPDSDSFASELRRLSEKGLTVAAADIAYTNGGDVRFVRALDRQGVLSSLAAYGGWNTPGNTLGCVISTAAAQHLRRREQNRVHGLLYRLFDDVCYQAVVRSSLEPASAQQAGFNPEGLVRMINDSWNRLELQSFSQSCPEVAAAELPWNRLFEVQLQLHMKEPAAVFEGA